VTARSQAEAAYFTLLRAIDERDALLREREFLLAERARLERFVEELQEAEATLPRRPIRTVAATTKPLLEAVGGRRRAVEGALGRIDERLEAAEAFVRECEEEHARLRS
jgi:cell division septum initiation protein DivIVA